MTKGLHSSRPLPDRGQRSWSSQRGVAMAAAAVFVSVGVYTCSQLFSPGEGTTTTAVELADQRALGRMAAWNQLPTLGTGRYRQQSSEDRNTGELAPLALWQRGNRDMNNFICAGDQADPPRDGTPFVLDMDRCPEPHVQGYVMARFEGSGRLTRIWMTGASLRKRPADHEVLRIYVDDRRQPVVQAPLRRVLDGSAGEIFAPPFGVGSSRRLAWTYPVVFGEKLIVSLDHLDPRDLYFHQTAVVLDASQQPRRAASSRLAARDQVRKLLRSKVPTTGTPQTKRLSLGPQQSVQTHQLAGPATIVNVRTRVSRAQLQALDEVTLQVRWDDEAMAAIELPLSLLFAAIDAPPTDESLALGAKVVGEDVVLSLRLPMPFETQAEWRLTNRGAETVDLELELETVSSLPPPPWGHLAVQHYETERPNRDAHPLVRATGRGRLVGVCLSMRGHGMRTGGRLGHPFHFLEGDELGIIDGTRALPGTGTEDYFNGAFYFDDGPGGNAFAQVWNIVRKVPDKPGQARASACRWHVLGDAIDFAESLELDMEIGPGDPSVLDRYRSVAFLYQRPQMAAEER
jgi:hypothetical protein